MPRVVAVPFRALLCALALIALVASPARSTPPRAGPATARALARTGQSLAGQLLVATEGLQGSPFARTVVYVVRHDAGAWITVSADPDILFDDDYATKWDRATARRRLSI
jgi:putative AlgH/UPF0301 family transcriptional regulator